MKPLLCFAVLVLTSAKICIADEKKAAEAREYQKHNKREILYPDVLDSYPANQNYGGEYEEKSKLGYSPVFNHANGQHVINLLNVGTGKDLLHQENQPVLLQPENSMDYHDGSFGYGEEEEHGIVFGNGNKALGQGHEGIFLGNGNKAHEEFFLGSGDSYKGFGQSGNNGYFGNSKGVYENEAVNLDYFDKANNAILGSNINIEPHDEIVQLENSNTDFLNYGSVNGDVLNFANSASNTDTISSAGSKGNLKNIINLGNTGSTNFKNIVSLNNAGIKGASIVSLNSAGNNSVGKHKYTVINLEHLGKQKNQDLVTEKPKTTYGGTINIVNDLKQKPIAITETNKQTVSPSHKPDTIPVIKVANTSKPSVEPTSLNYGEEIKDNPNSSEKRIRIPVKLIPLPGKPQQFKIEHISPEDLPLIKKQQEEQGGSEGQHIAIIKHIPVAFAKYVDKPYPLKIYVEKPVIHQKIIKVPYKVEIPKPYTVVKKVPFPVKVYEQVPKPYPVYKDIPVPVTVYVDKHVPKYVDKPIPVKVGKDGRVLEESSSEKEKINYTDFKHVKPLTLKEFQELEAKSLSETQLHSLNMKKDSSEHDFKFTKKSVGSNIFGNHNWQTTHGFGNSASASENKPEYMGAVKKPNLSDTKDSSGGTNVGHDSTPQQESEKPELDAQATNVHEASDFKGSIQLPDLKNYQGNDFSQQAVDPFTSSEQSKGSDFIPYGTLPLEHTNSYEKFENARNGDQQANLYKHVNSAKNANYGNEVKQQLNPYEYVTSARSQIEQPNTYENGYPATFKQRQIQQSASESAHSHVSVSAPFVGKVPDFDKIIEQESAKDIPQIPKYKRSGVSWSPVLEQFQPTDAVTGNLGFGSGNKISKSRSESEHGRGGRTDFRSLRTDQILKFDGRSDSEYQLQSEHLIGANKVVKSTDLDQQLQSERLNLSKDLTIDQSRQSNVTKRPNRGSKTSLISKDTHATLQHGFVPMEPVANKRSSNNYYHKAADLTKMQKLNTEASSSTKKASNTGINTYALNSEANTFKKRYLNNAHDSYSEASESLNIFRDSNTNAKHKNEVIKPIQEVVLKPAVKSKSVSSLNSHQSTNTFVAPELSNEFGFKPMNSSFVVTGLNLQQDDQVDHVPSMEALVASKIVYKSSFPHKKGQSSLQNPEAKAETKSYLEAPRAEALVTSVFNDESGFQPMKSGFVPMGTTAETKINIDAPRAEALVAHEGYREFGFRSMKSGFVLTGTKVKTDTHTEAPRAEALVTYKLNDESSFRPMKSDFVPMGKKAESKTNTEAPTAKALAKPDTQENNLRFWSSKSGFVPMGTKTHPEVPRAEALVAPQGNIESSFRPMKSNFAAIGLDMQQNAAEVSSAEALVASKIIYKSRFEHMQAKAENQATKVKAQIGNESGSSPMKSNYKNRSSQQVSETADKINSESRMLTKKSKDQKLTSFKASKADPTNIQEFKF